MTINTLAPRTDIALWTCRSCGFVDRPSASPQPPQSLGQRFALTTQFTSGGGYFSSINSKAKGTAIATLGWNGAVY